MAAQLATPDKGAVVISASSFSKVHPPSAIIDKNPSSFWMTTGSFPQEIVVQLAESSVIKSIEVVSTGIRSIELWGSDGYSHSTGERMAKFEANDSDGELQRFTLPLTSKNASATCLRVKILNGWNDFASIHKFSVTGTAAERK
jgi:heat shock protein beta-11